MATGEELGKEVATKLESAGSQKTEDGFKKVFNEAFDEMVKNAGDESFRKAANQILHDGKNDVAVLANLEIVGVDPDGNGVLLRDAKTNAEATLTKTGQLVQKASSETTENKSGNKDQSNDGNKPENKSEGTTQAQPEVWGKAENDRKFKVNEDGTASYEIKGGDTVWAVARDVLREKLKNETPPREPSNKEILEQVIKIGKANPQFPRLDQIMPGKSITIPKEDVDAIKEGRKKKDEPNPAKENPAPTHPPADNPQPTKPPSDNPAPTQPPADNPQPTKPPSDNPAPTQPPGDPTKVERKSGETSTGQQMQGTVLDFMQKNFKQFDKDNDNHVTAEEIDKYVQEHEKEMTPDQVAEMRRLRDRVGDVEELNDDETFDENDGITLGDLSQAREREKALEYARSNFDRLDNDGDGHVTEEDIDRYMRAKQGQMSPEEVRHLELLKQQIGDLEEYSDDEYFDENDGFTRKDVEGAAKESGTFKDMTWTILPEAAKKPEPVPQPHPSPTPSPESDQTQKRESTENQNQPVSNEPKTQKVSTSTLGDVNVKRQDAGDHRSVALELSEDKVMKTSIADLSLSKNTTFDMKPNGDGSVNIYNIQGVVAKTPIGDKPVTEMTVYEKDGKVYGKTMGYDVELPADFVAVLNAAAAK